MSPLDASTQQLLEQIIDRLDVVLRKQDEQDARLRGVETALAGLSEWKRAAECQYPELSKRLGVVEVAGGAVKAKTALIWALVCAALSALVSAGVAAIKGGAKQ